MRGHEIVRQFVAEKRPAYEALLGIVCANAASVKGEVGSGVILDTYSRADKQGGNKLKETAKILDAVKGRVGFEKLQRISDIIGMTIVVQYSDQVKGVLDRVKEKLLPLKIIEKERKLLHGTYFATHAVYESQAGVHQGLRCEVQCKTLLHNAWAAKMHDLTYKPQGSMDLRLRNLVEAISTTLEGLEQQSQTVRDIIVARHNVERRPFQATLKVVHSRWTKILHKTWEDKGALRGVANLWNEVEAAETQVVGSGAESLDLDKLGQDIRDAARNENIRVCWIMAVKLIGLRATREPPTLMLDLAQILMERMPRLLKADLLTGLEIRAIPLGFYMIQNFDHAIDYADRLLDRANELQLDSACWDKLRFNKATWLLERESLRVSRPWVAEAVRKDVTRLLNGFRRRKKFREGPQFTDTDGLRLIVFGDTKEEVRKGIEMCAASVELTHGKDEQEVAAAYADWRAHVGWRRYFELAEKGS